MYPPRFNGQKEEPAYETLMHAVNGFNPWCDVYITVSPYRAKPGTIIKVHGGLHKFDASDYRSSGGLWQHGTHTFVASGEPGKPIAIVAAGDGEVIFDGNGCDNLFNIMAADYLYFEGLTIRDTRIAFHGGFQGVKGCKGLTVKRCRIENVAYGVLAQDGRSTDFYIADNIFIGRNAPDQFHPTAGDAYGRSAAGDAVNLAGSGHVVCYNYCAQFWDCLNVFTGCLADPALGQQALAIDFYNNDLHQYLRQLYRGRRQHAQHPVPAQPLFQRDGRAVVLATGLSRADILDSQRRVQRVWRHDGVQGGQRRQHRRLP